MTTIKSKYFKERENWLVHITLKCRIRFGYFVQLDIKWYQQCSVYLSALLRSSVTFRIQDGGRSSSLQVFSFSSRWVAIFYFPKVTEKVYKIRLTLIEPVTTLEPIRVARTQTYRGPHLKPGSEVSVSWLPGTTETERGGDRFLSWKWIQVSEGERTCTGEIFPRVTDC